MKILTSISRDIVSVDVGFGFIKVLSTNGLRAILPSLIGSAIPRKDLGFGKQEENENNIEVIINEKGYFVGELANKELEERHVFEKNRANERTLNLIATAIQLVNPTNDPVYLVTGLPLEQYSADKESFKSYLDGKVIDVEWVSGTHHGQTIQTKIEESLISPQGAAAIIASISKADGTMKYPEFMFPGSLLALIDIGYRTTDIIVVEVQENGRSLKPIESMSFTIDEEGMSNVTTYITQKFKGQFKQDIPGHTLSQIFKGSKFMINGELHDYSPVLEEARQRVVNRIITRIRDEWREKESILTCAFLAGGGALTLREKLEQNFKVPTKLIEDSQYANAIGYLRAGKPYFARKEKEKANAF